MKSLNEGDDNSPKCMVVFSWLIILSGKNTLADSLILKTLLGLVMLTGVIMIMGELIMDWSLKFFYMVGGVPPLKFYSFKKKI